jgi:hypothetical protein
MNSAGRRPYTSPLRAQGAWQTTDLILSAEWRVTVKPAEAGLRNEDARLFLWSRRNPQRS